MEEGKTGGRRPVKLKAIEGSQTRDKSQPRERVGLKAKIDTKGKAQPSSALQKSGKAQFLEKKKEPEETPRIKSTMTGEILTSQEEPFYQATGG